MYDRGPLETIARTEQVALQNLGFHTLSMKDHTFLLDDRVIAPRIAKLLLGQLDLFRLGSHPDAHVDDFHAPHFICVSVPLAMGSVKITKHLRPEWDIDLIPL